MPHPSSLRPIALILDGQSLDPKRLWSLARTALDPTAAWAIEFSPEAQARMRASADLVERMSRSDTPVYGVNTGFGHFAERRIPPDRLAQLQVNLIRSHACGIGAEVSREIVLALWLLRLNTLSRGYSGIRPETAGFFLRLLRAGILGCVPSRGSVGASGDLTPSAHAALVILGEGFCTRPAPGADGFERIPSSQALAEAGIQPVPLGPKEGLALLNGTQFTTALAIKTWYEAEQLLRTANLAAAMTMAAMGGPGSILNAWVLDTHHPQTAVVGREMADWLAGSDDMPCTGLHDRLVQAPYCLRCAPQVHGAVLLTIETSEASLAAEIAAVTDNPLFFPGLNGGEAHSCGNFHAIYPARVSDNLASALTTLGAISERRINMAMDDRFSSLPAFLTPDGGLNSGFMMAQVTAAALVGECRALSMPASVDSIPTNCGREDHVPMGPLAGHKALQVIGHVRHLLAIELLVAAQGLDLVRDAAIPPRLAKVHDLLRQKVSFLTQDRALASDIAAINEMIENNVLCR